MSEPQTSTQKKIPAMVLTDRTTRVRVRNVSIDRHKYPAHCRAGRAWGEEAAIADLSDRDLLECRLDPKLVVEGVDGQLPAVPTMIRGLKFTGRYTVRDEIVKMIVDGEEIETTVPAGEAIYVEGDVPAKLPLPKIRRHPRIHDLDSASQYRPLDDAALAAREVAAKDRARGATSKREEDDLDDERAPVVVSRRPAAASKASS